MTPVVTGFGGQGLITSGTCGAPPATLAFPWVCEGMPWVPAVQPELVVVYQGTNDPGTPLFAERYLPFLKLVREWYPATRIFAVVPHNQGRHAEAIKSAVGKMCDARIHFLDYATGVLALADTSDGCHLNPGGAVRLGVRVATDIRRLSG